MNKIILANILVKSNSYTRDNLFKYYNENCVDFVKPSRKYHMKSGDNWCAMFISAISHMVGDLNFIYEVSVYEMVKLAKDRGIYSESCERLDVGDLVVYNWGGVGVPDHIGIIKGIKEGVLEVVEGNYKGGVNIRFVKTSSKDVQGYIKQ